MKLLTKFIQRLNRPKVFDGIPAPYDKQKRMVVPSTIRVLKLKPGRKFCYIGRLFSETGWKYGGIIKSLEEKRKAKSAQTK